MSLSKKNLAAIKALNRKDVRKTLESLKPFVRKAEWIGKRNGYSTDPAKKIEDQIGAGGLKSPRQLSQCVAASGFLHCADGWSYLGRAVSSLLNGDPHRSLHLAYYAELRAAMSLLASEGIGIYNRDHCIIDAPNSVAFLEGRPGTHVIVWECLEAWGEQARSGDLFSQIVTPNGRSLDDWLHPVGGARAIAPQAKKWFLQWGMDLKLPVKDRRARNESSYRPDGLPIAWYDNAVNALDFVGELWAALEPAASASFDAIDRHILRLGVEAIYRGQVGREPMADPAQFRKFVTPIVDRQGMGEMLEDRWIKFLCRESSLHDSAIFQKAKTPPNATIDGHLAIMSRALLLLRVAAGSNLELMSSAKYTKHDLGFWWKEVGKARGIIDGEEVGSLTDLWADVVPVLESIKSFRSVVEPEKQTFYRIGRELSAEAVVLGGCERAAMWSLSAL